MQPTLLHLLSDQRLAERQAARPRRVDRPRRRRSHLPERVRSVVGGLLITLGTRVSGSGPAPVELRGRPSA
jgi:hypothetical protein